MKYKSTMHFGYSTVSIPYSQVYDIEGFLMTCALSSTYTAVLYTTIDCHNKTIESVMGTYQTEIFCYNRRTR